MIAGVSANKQRSDFFLHLRLLHVLNILIHLSLEGFSLLHHHEQYSQGTTGKILDMLALPYKLPSLTAA